MDNRTFRLMVGLIVALSAYLTGLSHAESPTPGNGYDPCDYPNRAVLELVDKGDEIEEIHVKRLVSYLVDHCKMKLEDVNKLFTIMMDFKRQENLARQARKVLMNPEPYFGLYKQSFIETQEWDMVALFGNTRNRANCLGAQKVIQAADGSGEYRCVELPEDWRKHSVNEVIQRPITLDK